jgi:hypothetical protein
VQDQPVVRVAAERPGHDLFQLDLDLVDGLAGRQAGAIAHAEHVGVDREGFVAKRGIEDNVRRFPPDAG